ncbi:MAG: alpha/beta-type small acid-soluble spore protein [Clostridiaceae bacterium]|nr:alpha/beta-type small acid-soluble spore protein [Clostridiaceae bacterium]
MATNNRSRSRTQFDNMKYEIAGQLGINLKQGYNGDLTSREAGTIGGNIVKKVFESYTGNQYPQYDTNQQSK